MNIVTALNKKYIDYTVVMLTSVCVNAGEHVEAFLLNSELDDCDVEYIQAKLAGRDINVHSINIDKKAFEGKVVVNEIWSVEAYYRLMLLDVLPIQIDKVLYLDVDVIVNKSLQEMYHTDMGEDELFACIDGNGAWAWEQYSPKQREMFADMISRGYTYFNSGVLLMNIELMRQRYNFETYLAAMKEWNYEMVAPDQDILNYVHGEKTGFIDDQQYDLFAVVAHKAGWTREDAERIATIIHYAVHKPWSDDKASYDIEDIWWDYAYLAGYKMGPGRSLFVKAESADRDSEQVDDRALEIDVIEKRLVGNPLDYKNYIAMGDYLSDKNQNQAYLSYENADFLCTLYNGNNVDECARVRAICQKFKEENSIDVRPVSIVILSFNTLDFTRQCINSIRQKCKPPTYEIIIVDNASTDGSIEWLREQKDIILIENKENAGFAGGCNQGIEAATTGNDIFLLNSDTVVLDNSLYTLRMGLYSDKKVGTAGACSNYAGRTQNISEIFDTANKYAEYAYHNNLPLRNKLEKKEWLIGFALLIKNEVVEKIGGLDTLFGLGNFEDVDYGIRVMEAGYQNILCWNSFILHYGNQSFLGAKMDYTKLYKTNLSKIKEKWQFDVDYYSHIREDVIGLIQEPKDKKITVLEIGCGLGVSLNRIQYMYPNAKTYGVEIVEKVAELGKTMQNIICGNIEDMELPYDIESFDYIMMGDVIEHLIDPWAVIGKLKNYLNPNGKIIASIPNLLNAENVYKLLRGDFNYEESGVRDRTHLRFFTRREMEKMFAGQGFSIVKWAMSQASGFMTEDFGEFFDALCKIDGMVDRQEFDAYQYLFVAQRQ